LRTIGGTERKIRERSAGIPIDSLGREGNDQMPRSKKESKSGYIESLPKFGRGEDAGSNKSSKEEEGIRRRETSADGKHQSRGLAHKSSKMHIEARGYLDNGERENLCRLGNFPLGNRTGSKKI